MKLTDLEVTLVEEVIDETPEGQKNHYRLVAKNDMYRIAVGADTPFEGFKPGTRISVTIGNPQSTLG
jgi:hypothetical protein